MMASMQQQVIGWTAAGAEGHCEVTVSAEDQDPSATLSCSEPAMSQLADEKLKMIAGVLAAYRRIDPDVTTLSVDCTAGSCELALR